MKKLFSLLAALLGVVFFASTAIASPIVFGTANFIQATWSASVYYEAWNPHDTGGGHGDIADYLYLYDITNNSGSVALHQFTVGNPWQIYISGAGVDAGIVPLVNITTTSTVYSYYSTEIPGTGFSNVYLTSPYSPVWVSGSLQNGGTSRDQPVPGPGVPEPSSMLLLGMGILGIFGLKRKVEV